MQNAIDTVHTAPSPAEKARASALSDRLLGILLMSVAPALFWTAVTAVVLPYAGVDIAVTDLAAIGTAIALFLAVIAAAITERAS